MLHRQMESYITMPNQHSIIQVWSFQKESRMSFKQQPKKKKK